MNHGSLFSGIGGFDLAARWMGWRNVFQVEIDPWAQKLLRQNFPEVEELHNDVKTFNAKKYHGKIDIISGGFPCQPFSSAGKRKGTEDERHLWPEMLRAIREIQPRYVVGENVRGLLSWNGGLVFEQVQADLEAAGYHVLPFLLPAAGCGAQHLRYRTWFIAHTSNTRPQRSQQFTSTKRAGQKAEERRAAGMLCTPYYNLPTAPRIRGTANGLPNRVDRIKGLGNAVVPQVVLQLFKAIENTEQEYNSQNPKK